MHINEALNLAIPARYTESGDVLFWAYHTPISTEVFTANYRIISETNAQIWGKGLKYAATAGARIANLMLLDVSKRDSEEYATEDFGPKFLQEITRLTHILAPTQNGFEMLPVDIAIQRKTIEKEDWNEAEAAIVFFTVGYAMCKRVGRKAFCEEIASRIGGSITSLPPMEFAASLSTSTPDATTAPTALPSSHPS